AQLNAPYGIAVDGSGNVYVADTGNEVIRLLRPSPGSVALVNAASGVGGSVAPGEIVTIFGTGLGPDTPVIATPAADGSYAAQLGGTIVFFNSTPAPIIYSSATQVSAIVPYAMQAGGEANITVVYNGQALQDLFVPIASSAPGIFTADATGSGQAAVVNQDGSINSPANPAKLGTVVSVYATGE